MTRATFFDSSTVLSMLLADDNADKALTHWETAEVRLASKLLLFESQVVIHRCVSKMPGELADDWKKSAQAWLRHITENLILHEVNDRVLLTIQHAPKLATCRTLDSIHIATALVFQSEGAILEISSFDSRLNETARNLELNLST